MKTRMNVNPATACLAIITIELFAAICVDHLSAQQLAGPQPASQYEAAFAASSQDGKPIVVLVGAAWCPHCRVMKNQTIPAAIQAGALNGTHFAYVDFDQEQAIAKFIQGPGNDTVPVLAVYRRNVNAPGGWQKNAVNDEQSVENIRLLVQGR